MTTNKTLGFYDFHVTADKTRDYFIANDFKADEVLITKIVAGQPLALFDTDGHALPVPVEVPLNDAVKKEHHHGIREFFKHLLHRDGKTHKPGAPLVAESDGFILSVITTDPLKKELARQILDGHGARFIKEF